MTVRRSRTHHRPAVRKLRRLFMPWRVECPTCGYSIRARTWHVAWVIALAHAETVL
jgi:hypothetical protein